MCVSLSPGAAQVLANGAAQPFAHFLNYSAFAIELDTRPLLACPRDPPGFAPRWGFPPGASEDERLRLGFPSGANGTQWPTGLRCPVTAARPQPQSALQAMHNLAQQARFFKKILLKIALCFIAALV